MWLINYVQKYYFGQWKIWCSTEWIIIAVPEIKRPIEASSFETGLEPGTNDCRQNGLLIIRAGPVGFKVVMHWMATEKSPIGDSRLPESVACDEANDQGTVAAIYNGVQQTVQSLPVNFNGQNVQFATVRSRFTSQFRCQDHLPPVISSKGETEVLLFPGSLMMSWAMTLPNGKPVTFHAGTISNRSMCCRKVFFIETLRETLDHRTSHQSWQQM